MNTFKIINTPIINPPPNEEDRETYIYTNRKVDESVLL